VLAYIMLQNGAHSDTSFFREKLSASNLFHNKFQLYVNV